MKERAAELRAETRRAPRGPTACRPSWTRASSSTATAPWASRTPRTSTTAKSGPPRSRSGRGARPWRRRSPPWWSPPAR